MRELTRLDRMRLAGSASISLFVGTESYDRGYARHNGVCSSINATYREATGMPMRAYVASVYDQMQHQLNLARSSPEANSDKLILYPAQPGEFGIVVGLDEGQLARHAIYVVNHKGVEIPIFIDCFPPKQEVELPKGGVFVVDHAHADDMPGKSAKWLGPSHYIVSPRAATSLLSDPFAISKAEVHIFGESHDSDRYTIKAVERTSLNGGNWSKGSDISIEPMQKSSITYQDSGIRVDARNFKISHGFPEDNNGFIITVYKDGDPVRRIINIGDGVLTHKTIVTETDPVESLRYALLPMAPGVPIVVLATSGHTGYLEWKTEPNHGILSTDKVSPLLKVLGETGFLDDVSDIYVTARHLENLAIPGGMIFDEAKKLSAEWCEKRKAEDIHPRLVDVWKSASKDHRVIENAIVDLYENFGFSLTLDSPLEDIREKDAQKAAESFGKTLTVVKKPTVVAGDLVFEGDKDPFEHVAA